MAIVIAMGIGFLSRRKEHLVCKVSASYASQLVLTFPSYLSKKHHSFSFLLKYQHTNDMESGVSKDRKKEKSTVKRQCKDLPLWHPVKRPLPDEGTVVCRSQRGRRREISRALVSVRKKWDRHATDEAAKETNFRAQKKALERDVPYSLKPRILILIFQIFFSFFFFLKKKASVVAAGSPP